MLHRLVAVIALLVLATMSNPGFAATGGPQRVALVIGNSDYLYGPKLRNPANDAKDIAAELSKAGFEVILKTDANRKDIGNALGVFTQKLRGAEVGLFFYAGHGVQVNGVNYLIATDFDLNSKMPPTFDLVPLNWFQEQMELLTGTRIILLDACRDNPLANIARTAAMRALPIEQGLAKIEAKGGTFIGYSTQPGNVATDGTGRNSPYAGALLKRIPERGKNLDSVMIEVRKEVMSTTAGQQVPWDSSALTEDFYFVPPGLENKDWALVQSKPRPEALKTFLDNYPDGEHAP